MKIVSENQFSGKTYFYTIAYREARLAVTETAGFGKDFYRVGLVV